MFDMPIGSADGQQLWECLAILVAIDIWSKLWNQQRIILKVRSDNVGALTLLLKMRPANATIAKVARELALRLADLSFPPDAMHTPGVAHVLADRLSRVFAPGGTGTVTKDLHPALASAQLTDVPVRVPAWYKATQQTPPPA